MGTAFNYMPDDFRLMLIKNIRSKNAKNADEIVSVIKEFWIEITEQISSLESLTRINDNAEIELAILIRQNQYLEYLLNKQKYELVQIFNECSENCITPEVFKWYNTS